MQLTKFTLCTQQELSLTGVVIKLLEPVICSLEPLPQALAFLIVLVLQLVVNQR